MHYFGACDGVNMNLRNQTLLICGTAEYLKTVLYPEKRFHFNSENYSEHITSPLLSCDPEAHI